MRILADYALSLQLVLNARAYLLQSDAVFSVFVSVDSSGFEVLVELLHLSLKLHDAPPKKVAASVMPSARAAKSFHDLEILLRA